MKGVGGEVTCSSPATGSVGSSRMRLPTTSAPKKAGSWVRVRVRIRVRVRVRVRVGVRG